MLVNLIQQSIQEDEKSLGENKVECKTITQNEAVVWYRLRSGHEEADNLQTGGICS